MERDTHYQGAHPAVVLEHDAVDDGRDDLRGADLQPNRLDSVSRLVVAHQGDVVDEPLLRGQLLAGLGMGHLPDLGGAARAARDLARHADS